MNDKNTVTIKVPSWFKAAFATKIPLTLALLVIAGMLVAWKPWQPVANANSRTISVTGEASIKAVPDEYVFSPQYEFKVTDKQSGNDQASAKSTEILAQLKKLNVPENKIKTSINSYESYDYNSVKTNNSTGYTYNLNITITLGTKESAQRVQDYLAGTGPTGAVTPYANFSDHLRKQLESQGRDAASKDARSKAEQSARNLGFKVGAVKTVSDGQNGGGIIPFDGCGRGVCTGVDSAAGGEAKSSIAVTPGEDSVNYTVTVVYYLR